MERDYGDPERNWGDYDDEEEEKLSLQEKKSSVQRMVQFGNEFGRPDLAEVGTPLTELLDECIAKEEETKQLIEENAKTLAQNEELEKEINKELEALDEQEKEIDNELDALEKELQQALSSKPPDEKLIEKLQQQKNDLLKLKEGCKADRARLKKYAEQTKQISKQCHSNIDRSNNVLTRANSKNFFDTPSKNWQSKPNPRDSDSNLNNSSRSAMGNLTIDQICDSYKDSMTSLLEETKELKKFMDNEVQAVRQQTTQNAQQLKDTQNEVQETQNNMQARSNRLAEIRNERQNQAANLAEAKPDEPIPVAVAVPIDDKDLDEAPPDEPIPIAVAVPIDEKDLDEEPPAPNAPLAHAELDENNESNADDINVPTAVPVADNAYDLEIEEPDATKNSQAADIADDEPLIPSYLFGQEEENTEEQQEEHTEVEQQESTENLQEIIDNQATSSKAPMPNGPGPSQPAEEEDEAEEEEEEEVEAEEEAEDAGPEIDTSGTGATFADIMLKMDEHDFGADFVGALSYAGRGAGSGLYHTPGAIMSAGSWIKNKFTGTTASNNATPNSQPAQPTPIPDTPADPMQNLQQEAKAIEQENKVPPKPPEPEVDPELSGGLNANP